MFELNGSYSDVQKTKTANRSRFWLPKIGTLDERIEERCLSSWEQLASLCLNTALVRWEQIVWHRLQNILTYAKLFSCAAKHWSAETSGVLNIAIYFKTYKMFPYFAKQWFAWNTSSAKHCYIKNLRNVSLLCKTLISWEQVACSVQWKPQETSGTCLRCDQDHYKCS